MLSKVYAITGYKPQELGIFSESHQGIDVIKYTLRSRIIQLIEESDIDWFITSGQPGVELWASEIIIELKNDYPNINLCILTPFYEQEARWKEPLQEKYHQILEQADFVDSITKRPYENPSQLRLKNEFIINKSNGLLVLYDEETPGSPSYYLTPAKQRLQSVNQDYEILTITKFDIELAEQELKETNPDFWSQTH